MTHTLASLLALAIPGAGGAGLSGFVIQVALIFAIFYFLLIRPQQKQRRQHEDALRNLKKGDRVVTTGGIIGEVIHVKEATKDGAAVKSMDDEITIKSAESRLVVERGRIGRIVGGTAAPTA